MGRRFWKIWEKFSYLIAAVLFALICWASEIYGGLAIVRAGCAVFGILGTAILFYAWRLSIRAHASTVWRPAEARIVSSEVISEVGRQPFPQRDVTFTVGAITSYYPRVRYEYDVEGRTYTSEHIVLVNVNYSQADAHALVAKYAAGARVVAYVDPDDPRTAVLEAGLGGKGREYAIPAIVGAVFTLFGAVAWFLIPTVAK